MTQTERIAYMERILDEAGSAVQQLDEAIARYRAVRPRLDELAAYYTSGQWMKDYEDDEAGRLPADIKRGVLSEDAVYDLLRERDELERTLLAGLWRDETV